MASEIITESPSTTEDMILDISNSNENDIEINGCEKRNREEQSEPETETKKQKIKDEDDEKSVEEVRMENRIEEKNGTKENVGPVGLGPKTFGSSVEMFDYFHKLLHCWPLNLSVNKYEYLVLLDLIKKGHAEAEKKIGSGITAFEIRNHPMYKSRCLFVVRDNKSAEDFSFRKCVDQILPLPENMKIKADVNTVLGGNGKGKKGGGGGGRGAGGRGRAN